MSPPLVLVLAGCCFCGEYYFLSGAARFGPFVTMDDCVTVASYQAARTKGISYVAKVLLRLIPLVLAILIRWVAG